MSAGMSLQAPDAQGSRNFKGRSLEGVAGLFRARNRKV